jgi:hypothetical protein
LECRQTSKGEHHGQSRQTRPGEKEAEEKCDCTRQPSLSADRRLQDTNSCASGTIYAESNACAFDRKQTVGVAPFDRVVATALHP